MSDRVLSAVDAMERALAKLSVAPFDNSQWLPALKLLASATDSQVGQFIGWLGPNNVPFNMMSENLIDGYHAWLNLGGADPAKNPIIRRGVRARELEPVSDEDFISAMERCRHPLWNEFYDVYDMPHICFTPLWREGDHHLVMNVYRSKRTGPITNQERRIFSAVAQQARSAVLLARTLNNEAARIMSGAFNALSVEVVALDGFGRIVAMSDDAERTLRKGTALKLQAGTLIAANPIRGQFEVAVRRCTATAIHPCAPVSIAVAKIDRQISAVRVSPLPRLSHDFGFGAAAIVVLERAPSGDAVSLRPEFVAAFTPAETEIARALLRGEAPSDIAGSRHVSIETVRSQIKSVYAKADVANRSEFMVKASSKE